MYLHIQAQAAPSKKKKKKGKKPAQGGQQDKPAGKVTPPGNVAMAHEVAGIKSKAAVSIL